MQAVVADKL